MTVLQDAPVAPVKKSRKKLWIVLSILLALIVFSAVANNGGDTATSTGTAVVDAPADAAPPAEVKADEPAEVKEAAAGIGTAVRDGKFEFVVGEIECGVAEVGSEYLKKTAQGQFCLVSMDVKNIGDAPQTFFGDNIRLFNAEGQEYSADTEAGIYLDTANGNSFFAEINPGNQLSGKVVFDIPAGTVPASLELHDSAFSGGVEVAL